MNHEKPGSKKVGHQHKNLKFLDTVINMWSSIWVVANNVGHQFAASEHPAMFCDMKNWLQWQLEPLEPLEPEVP